MSIVLRAFPIRRPVQELREFIASLQNERKADTDQFYKQYGVSHESWHVQETPAGPWVIGLTLLDSPTEAAPRYAESNEEFESWFKAQILHFTGVDPNTAPLGPSTEAVFSWSDPERPNAALK